MQTRILSLAGLASLLSACGLAGCTTTIDAVPSADRSAVSLIPVTTLRLRDRDTSYIGKPNALAVSARGDVFVTDVFSRRVLHFDSSGSFVETVGRRGGGPNEFEGPSWLISINDTTLAIADQLRRQVVIWHLPSKSAQSRMALPGLSGAGAYSNGVLYASAADLENGTAGIRWRLPSTQPERLGKLLNVYRDRLPQIWGNVSVAVFADTIAYFGGRSQYVVIADSNWLPRDSIPIPRSIRKGIPTQIDYNLSGGRNIYDIMRQLSVPFGLHRLSGDRFAAFHLDASIVNNNVFGRVFMTVVSKQGNSRCVDVVVPTRDTLSIPRIALHGDTLFVLDQFVVTDSAVAEVNKYIVGEHLC